MHQGKQQHEERSRDRPWEAQEQQGRGEEAKNKTGNNYFF